MLRLPPLNALRAFEAVARHLSFKRAAEEFRVTQGAVSRHVLRLEAFLGKRLFERGHRQVRLTPDGARYLPAVRDAFVGIADATGALTADRGREMLRLRLPPTCAILWLVPRLARFNTRHPDIPVRVTTSHDPVEFDGGDVDVDAAIHYGGNPAPGLVAERLFGEVLVPAMSPALAARPPRLDAPADLLGHVLLHSIHRPDDWPQWFRLAGVPAPEFPDGLIFENSSLTYQGAIEGLGVAMAQAAFALDEVRSGRLVVPFDLAVRNEAAYAFVVPEANAGLRRVRLFRDWIAAEAALTRAAGARYAI